MLQSKEHDGTPNRFNLCGEQVRQIREKRGISLAQLQERLTKLGLHLDYTDLDMIEKGLREVVDVELVGLSYVLGVSPDQLVFGEHLQADV
jgi:hypothetical protein